jgi:hypothetical protein
MAGSKDFTGGLCRIHPPKTISSSATILPALMTPLLAASICFHPPHDDWHRGVSSELPPDACQKRFNFLEHYDLLTPKHADQ